MSITVVVKGESAENGLWKIVALSMLPYSFLVFELRMEWSALFSVISCGCLIAWISFITYDGIYWRFWQEKGVLSGLLRKTPTTDSAAADRYGWMNTNNHILEVSRNIPWKTQCNKQLT